MLSARTGASRGKEADVSEASRYLKHHSLKLNCAQNQEYREGTLRTVVRRLQAASTCKQNVIATSKTWPTGVQFDWLRAERDKWVHNLVLASRLRTPVSVAAIRFERPISPLSARRQ
jgi:hypothetical protein